MSNTEVDGGDDGRCHGDHNFLLSNEPNPNPTMSIKGNPGGWKWGRGLSGVGLGATRTLVTRAVAAVATAEAF